MSNEIVFVLVLSESIKIELVRRLSIMFSFNWFLFNISHHSHKACSSIRLSPILVNDKFSVFLQQSEIWSKSPNLQAGYQACSTAQSEAPGESATPYDRSTEIKHYNASVFPSITRGSRTLPEKISIARCWHIDRNQQVDHHLVGGYVSNRLDHDGHSHPVHQWQLFSQRLQRSLPAIG